MDPLAGGLPRAARLPHGRSVRPKMARVRRRPDRDVGRRRQLPRSRLREPEGGHLLRSGAERWRASRRPSRPAATGARTSCTTRARHHAVHLPVRHAVGRAAAPSPTTPPATTPRAIDDRKRQRRHLGELPDPLRRPLPVRRRATRRRAGGHPFGHGRSDGLLRHARLAQQNIVCIDDGNLGCLCTYDITSEPTRRRPERPLEHAGRSAYALRGHQAGPVASRPLRLGRHDDGLGPRPRLRSGIRRACAPSR